MPLPIGTRLDPYEILAPLGAGGMKNPEDRYASTRDPATLRDRLAEASGEVSVTGWCRPPDPRGTSMISLSGVR